MEVVQIMPSILRDKNINVTNPDSCQPPLQCRQGQSFKLGGESDKRKYVFEVFFDNYFTNEDTDFILDVQSSCMCLFITETSVPTVEDLYELYKQANHATGWKIVEEANKRKLMANFLPQNSPLELMEDGLNEVLATLFKD